MAERSSAYWRDRFRQLEEAQNDTSARIMQEIEIQFRRAEQALDEKINAWYQRFAANNEISMMDARRLLNSNELEEFHWDVEDYIKYGKENAVDERWMKQLENASAKVHISRLEALKVQTQQEAEKLFGNYHDAVDKHISDIYTSTYYHTAFEVQKGVGVGWDMQKLTEEKVSDIIHKPWAADGRNFSARIWTSKTQLINKLHDSLTRMCITGEAPDRAIRELSKSMGVSRSQAANIIQTESAAFSAKAQENCYSELDIEEFEVVETLDGHTCRMCGDMDGKHFPMKDYVIGVTVPPFHPRCRGCTCPYFDDEFTNGKRIARGADGKQYYVPEKMTFNEWKDSFVDGDKSGSREVTPDNTIKTEKTLDDCQTVEEVQDLMKNQKWFYETTVNGEPFNGNEKVDLTGVDLESAKSIFKTHERLFEKYPQLKGKFNAVDATYLDNGVEAQCFYGFGHGGISVNTKYYGDAARYARIYTKEVECAWSPKGTTWESALMHELGHAIDDYLTYTLQLGGELRGKPRPVSSVLRPKVMSKCGLTVNDENIKLSVSEYAAENPKEWFAECFAEFMDSAAPREVAKEFGRQLEELLKEVK